MKKLKINKNEKFGNLTIIKEVESMPLPSGGKNRRFACMCICRKQVTVILKNLRSSNTISCGCFNLKNKLKHNLSGHRLYRIYYSLNDRCFNQKNKNYSYYGGRGITSEWKNFEDFFSDMSPTWKVGLSLDRIDNNGNYSKKNCRWVNQKEQVRNTRRNVLFKNELAVDASIRLGGNKGLVRSRIFAGWSIEKAFTTPVKK